MEAEWARVKRAVGLANTVVTPAAAAAAAAAPPLRASLKRAADESIERCRVERKKQRARQTRKDLSDAAIARAAKWTDGLPLAEYEGILHLVPRLVNVVTASTHALERARRACAHARALRAARRGHPRPRLGRQAALGPARHRRALLECLLCAAQALE